MRSTPLAEDLMLRVDTAFLEAADDAQAVAMRAYMRDQFAFLGIRAPRQRELARALLAVTPRPVEADLEAIARACWRRPEREFQYFACDLLRRYAGRCGPGFIGVARHLIATRSWWDTVDGLAAHLVGPLVTRHPDLVSTMDEWIAEPDLWLVRTAILHQLTYKVTTDAERLFRYCTAQRGHRDFFVRKAIGWALREYAKTAPELVRTFVARAGLSSLSTREALRNIAAPARSSR